MLLLTDDLENGASLQRMFESVQACAMFDLDEALKQPADHAVIACHAALDNATSPKLRAALAHHRTDPGIPVLFLVHDSNVNALMHADALGATKALPASTAPDDVLVVVKRLVAASPAKARPKAAVATAESGVRETVLSLTSMFKAASNRQAISVAGLEAGADSLIASTRATKVKSWLDFVRRYDDLTYQHCLLVGGLVANFAFRLGIAARGQRLLAQAALVHDVGKALVPRHILNKTGALTAAELQVMRTHPGSGYDLLIKQNKLDPCLLDVVRHHHELLDGSGYPDGLRQGQISDFVRLVTICDIYAALIERRAYKPALPAQQAYAVLLEMNGKLDPSLLKAFGKMVGEM